ncbi:response regulator [Frankia gtarii]|uniref:response regulator n=1 Tax=Frankia gtarii TaxID=2950102 RepID=UPI0021C13337|nr:response regulator [Frankia gtarii]
MMIAAARRPFDVLLAEDDAGDAMLVEEAFASRGVGHHLHIVGDGVDALAYLRDPTRERPDLIILDLNMPRMGGREALSLIKEDQELRTIPVVVLTTSQAPDDVRTSYRLHANAYVCKPQTLDAFIEAVQSIDDFYLDFVRLASD